MYTILECGLYLRQDSSELEFDLAKALINDIAKHIKEGCRHQNSMSFIRIGIDKEYLTCMVQDGTVRFGTYHADTKSLRRDINVSEVLQIPFTAQRALILRAENFADKELCDPTLAALWNESIRRELHLSEKGLFTENVDTINVSVDDLKAIEELNID